MRSKVFIIEEITSERFDLRRATAYGDLVYVFPMNSRRAGMFDPRYEQNVLDALAGHRYDPRRDYICATGSIGPILLAVAAIACKFRRISVLLFNSASDEYVLKTIENERIEYGSRNDL
jgi:hypothetical protein